MLWRLLSSFSLLFSPFPLLRLHCAVLALRTRLEGRQTRESDSARVLKRQRRGYLRGPVLAQLERTGGRHGTDRGRTLGGGWGGEMTVIKTC